MSFRIKLFICFILTAVISNGLLFSLLFYQANHSLFRQIQSKAVSIVATAAMNIDGDKLRTIQSRQDEDTSAYREIASQLRAIRDANRRDDVHVAFIYTMSESVTTPGVIVFGVDPEESEEDKSHVGDVYKGTFGAAFSVSDRVIVDAVASKDQWGEWISAYAPIKDATGAVVSMLGVDLLFSDVRRTTTVTLIKWGMVACAAALVLACALAAMLVRHMSHPLRELHTAVNTMAGGDLDVRVNIETKDEFADLGVAFNAMAEGVKQREMLKSMFARYVSDQVLSSLLEKGPSVSLSGERRKITVLFSDIRNFTAFSSIMQPEDVVRLLNEYFEKMVEIVFKHQGMLDKFMGDGVMAIFGAPQEDQFQEEHAVAAAIEMRNELKNLCERWQAQGRMPIQIGIGINTGMAIVGSIGSNQHMEYTAIGDTVNLASRLESRTKELGVDILVSEYTYVTVKSAFKLERIDTISVKGRQDPVVVYAVAADDQSHGNGTAGRDTAGGG